MNHPEQLKNSTVLRTELANGTVILADPDSRFSSVTIAICFIGGLSDETEECVGVTHLLEHLLFKRTGTKGPHELAAAMDELGGEVNAFTDFDSLCVHGTAPGRQFRELAELLGEIVFEHQFGDAEISLEKEIVRQEILESSDSPSEIVYQSLSKTLWPGSIFRFPVFGTVDSIQRISESDLLRRRDTLFCGKRCVIACCGNVDPEELVAFAAARFGALPPGSHAVVSPPSRGDGFVTEAHQSNQVQLVLSQPWLPADSEELAAGLVLSTILGGGLSSRLFQRLREEEGLAYEVSTSVEMVSSQSNLLVSSVVERNHLEEALEIIMEELSRAAAGEIDEDEVERAKKLLSARYDLDMDSPGSRLWYALDHEIRSRSFVDKSHPDAVLAGLQKLRVEQVRRTAATWLLQNPGAVVFGGDVEGLSVSPLLAVLLNPESQKPE